MIEINTDIPVLKPYDIDKDISDKLGVFLLKKGIIDSKTLAKAILVKNNEKIYSNSTGQTKRNLAQILVQDFNYEHDIIFREVANLYAFKTLDIDTEGKDKVEIAGIKKLINAADGELKKLMLSYKLLPVKFDEKIKDKLIIAAVDPTLREIPKIAYSLNAKSYEVFYITANKYEQLIQNSVLPANEYLKNFNEETKNSYQEAKEEGSIDESLLEVEINKSALINLFEGALVEGVRRGASDLHIIPISSYETDLSFRIDGKLKLWHRQEGTLPEAMIAVVKDRSRGLDRFEREQGQDGYIQREIDGHVIRFRVSILPIAGTEIKNKFESVVIRILDDRKVITDLNELGLTGYAREAFQKSIDKPQGMIILTGPTGCGKSTTIIAALNNIMDPSLNILTVEDPIEYVIKGARQIKLSHKMNFDQAIRSILRHDPDVVLVGEIRDRETADIAIKLANTGHLTFTTLHTNDAPSVVSRLYKMGIEPFLLAYAINVIVAQRLIRKLCPKCKRRVNSLGDNYISRLKLDSVEWINSDVYEPVGCDKCSHTGYSGRIAIHETLYFTKDISQLIFNAGEKIDEEGLRSVAKKDGMLSLRESGYEKVKMGLTSFEELLANTTDN
jgi:type IV pilus assembly protein PilB